MVALFTISTIVTYYYYYYYSCYYYYYYDCFSFSITTIMHWILASCSVPYFGGFLGSCSRGLELEELSICPDLKNLQQYVQVQVLEHLLTKSAPLLPLRKTPHAAAFALHFGF